MPGFRPVLGTPPNPAPRTATPTRFRRLARLLVPDSASLCKLVLATLALIPVALIAQSSRPGFNAPPVLAQENIGSGTILLDGPWQFHLGDNPAWASSSTDDVTGHGGWEQITADSPWGAQGHPSYSGYAWYRRHLALNPGLNQNLVLLIPNVEDVYEIYWNGSPIARNGNFPPNPSFIAEEAHTYALGQVHDGVLAFRVWKHPLQALESDQVGGFTSPPSVGTPTAIAALKSEIDYEWMRTRQFDFLLDMLYLVVAVLCFVGWLRDRSHQQALLAMAGLTFSQAASDLMFSGCFQFPHGLIDGWAQPIISLSDIGLWYLLLYLFELNDNPLLARITRNLSALTFVLQAVLGVLVALDWSDSHRTLTYQILEFSLDTVVQLLEIFSFVLLWYAIKARRKLDFTRWLLAVTAFGTIMSVFVGLASLNGYRFTHFTLGQLMETPLFSIRGSVFNYVLVIQFIFLLVSAYAVFRNYFEATQRKNLLEQELHNARVVQHVLVPDELPATPGFEIRSVYKPFGEVGGDFFQVSTVSSGEILVVVGDVSGKGMPAAMTVSLLVGSFRTLAHYTQSPQKILAALNQRMLGRTNGGFTTCLVLRIDQQGKLTIANAGHLPPYMDGHELATDSNLPLGISEDTSYSETTCILPPDQQLTLITDGVLEARNPKTGELYGFDRTSAISKRSAEAIAQAAQNFGQDDDITVLTLTRL